MSLPALCTAGIRALTTTHRRNQCLSNRAIMLHAFAALQLRSSMTVNGIMDCERAQALADHLHWLPLTDCLVGDAQLGSTWMWMEVAMVPMRCIVFAVRATSLSLYKYRTGIASFLPFQAALTSGLSTNMDALQAPLTACQPVVSLIMCILYTYMNTPGWSRAPVKCATITDTQ